MLDFNHILSTPGADIQYFIADASAVPSTGSGGQQWQTWRKPRGCKFIYMLAVGGGASGGCGINNATTTSGGGGGGGSGGQSMLMIPAMMVPDVLYVQCGQGGRQPATLVSGAAGVYGTTSQVCIEPFTSASVLPNDTVLLASGGSGGGTASPTGSAGAGGTAATIANMPLAGRGIYTLLAGQTGTAGGAPGISAASVTVPTTGLMVTGGGGGGGKTATVFGAGSVITMPTGGVSTGSSDFFPLTGATPAAASAATPAGSGANGIIVRNMILNLGGGGGGSASETSGGIAGAGGNGAPGCAGGGGGGSSATPGVTTLARPGDGGDGFVYIISV